MQDGPVLQVEISLAAALVKHLTDQGQPVPQPVAGWALIDTGATAAAVDAAWQTEGGLRSGFY